MFNGIDENRYTNMTDQEKRWFDNVKKAFFASDQAFESEAREDDCFPEIFKAIDTAKTLRHSLMGEGGSYQNNRAKFIEFINLEVPPPDKGGVTFSLFDNRKNKSREYCFASLAYDIRCMIHENENLNAAEKPEYHILLDWSSDQHSRSLGTLTDGRVVVNAVNFWLRLQEIMSKFITGIEFSIAIRIGKNFEIRVDAPLGSIQPQLRRT